MRPRPSKSLDLGLKFRGFLRSRLAFSSDFEGFRGRGWLKSSRIFWGYTSKNPQKSRQGWGHECWGFSRIPQKNLEKMNYFVHKNRGFSRILEKSASLQVWGFFKGGLGSLEFRGWDLERLFLLRGFRGLPSKSSSSWGIFEAKPRKTLYFRGEAEGMIFEDFDHPSMYQDLKKFEIRLAWNSNSNWR